MSEEDPQLVDFRHLLPPHCRGTLRSWLQEDIPSFDLAGVVVGERPEEAVLLCKSAGVLCGVPFFEMIFSELGCSVRWLFSEGAYLRCEGVCVCTFDPVLLQFVIKPIL